MYLKLINPNIINMILLDAMNPSRDLYRMRLSVVPGSSLIGWYLSNSLPKYVLNRKKSIISQAASISAYEINAKRIN